MYQEFKFEGPFKDELENFIAFKRSLGYDYGKTMIYLLAKMNKFLLMQGIAEIKIPESVYMHWICLKESESTSTQEKRYNAIHGFARFLISKGYPDVYDTENHVIPRKEFTPYIFTSDEITRIFKCADSYRPENNPTVFFNNNMVPVLLRLLYSTGLRISEALSIRFRDLDLENGVIAITDGKNHVGRNIVVSPSMKRVLGDYISTMTSCDTDGFLFCGCDGRAYTANMARKAFHRILDDAAINKRPSGNYPRLHDFRHLFSIRALEQMVDKGYDLYTSLPILCKYLGHKSIIETEYYIRLTKNRFSQITQTSSSYAPSLFPVMEVCTHG